MGRHENATGPLCVAADIQSLEGFEGREMCRKKPSLAFEQWRHVIR